MRAIGRHLVPAAIAALLVAAGPLGFSPRASAGLLEPDDTRAGKAALKAVEESRWRAARRHVARIRHPLAAKLIRFLALTGGDPGASFAEIKAFLEDNPDWPDRRLLRQRAEEAMTDATPAAAVLAWFDRFEPVSTSGRVRLGRALLAGGQKAEARSVLRDAWINGRFAKGAEKRFYRRYRGLLSLEDHMERLDRLLWDGRNWSSRRMLWKVKPDYRALGEARFLLRHMRGNVDRAIARVPAGLKDHPGLVYERLRWRRRKGRMLSALELLNAPPAELVRPEKWWTERAALARRALEEGLISTAYRVVRDHGLSDGAPFAEAEWLAGWIALRFLDDAKGALGHFTAMFEQVEFPVSRARAAYWCARAAAALDDPLTAGLWDHVAIRYPTTYYGQLSQARINPKGGVRLPSDPVITAAARRRFDDHELVRTVRMLGEMGGRQFMRPFIRRLNDPAEISEWRGLTAMLARAEGRPDLAIEVAKRAIRTGVHLLKAGYPKLELPEISNDTLRAPVEDALVLAVIRQESAFRPSARSRAGAQGLMQVLPRTAAQLAKRLKLPYSRRRLASDPGYNLRLGQAYLHEMIEHFDGSYVLALGAYNAGPTRVRHWIRLNGDPRDADVDVIDWIELIPFDETRNYVQRVMEGLQVYRALLAETEVALTIENDLER